MQQQTEESIQHGLIERLMGEIKTKNDHICELTKQKNMIESNLSQSVD